MKKFLIPFFIIFIHAALVHTASADTMEYLYPVAHLDEHHLLIMHQKHVDDVELLIWDIESGTASKALSYIFLPSCVQLLPTCVQSVPDKSEFSFIDRGTVRIKSLYKRAPRSIYLHDFATCIFSMTWISPTQFYFTGTAQQKLSLFLCELSNEDCYAAVYRLHDLEPCDFAYGCKIDDTLFCIKKNNTGEHSVIALKWQPTSYDQENINRTQEIVMQSSDPLCFLHMQSKGRGFAVRYDASREQRDDVCYFTCLALSLEPHAWTAQGLFQFKIPACYLTGQGPERLYESIKPFLPRYADGMIYFSDFDSNFNECNVYQYDLCAAQAVKLTVDTYRSMPSPTNVCTPYKLSGQLFAGFFGLTHTARSLLHVDQDNGCIACQLPTLKP